MEAGELLGCSERQFRRYRDRYEEEGLAGLIDKRLGRVSAKRVPADEIAWMLDQYRGHYLGWNVKYFMSSCRSGMASGGVTPGRRRSCIRLGWSSVPSAAERTDASGRASRARA